MVVYVYNPFVYIVSLVYYGQCFHRFEFKKYLAELV